MQFRTSRKILTSHEEHLLRHSNFVNARFNPVLAASILIYSHSASPAGKQALLADWSSQAEASAFRRIFYLCRSVQKSDSKNIMNEEEDKYCWFRSAAQNRSRADYRGQLSVENTSLLSVSAVHHPKPSAIFSPLWNSELRIAHRPRVRAAVRATPHAPPGILLRRTRPPAERHGSRDKAGRHPADAPSSPGSHLPPRNRSSVRSPAVHPPPHRP